MDFQSLGLRDVILAAVAGQGYATPTPIQARAIPHILAGEDCLGIAQTGTGKTAAFAIPIIQRLMDAPPVTGNQPKRPRALVLSPTRELATQIAQSFRTYGEGSGLSGTTIYGGVGQGGQVKALQRGIDILVATPGRLLDLMGQGYIDLRFIEIFVLDEADRMLDMGFIKPIRQIIAEIPKQRQSLLFSATMPGEIQGLADSMLDNPVRVEVAPPRSTASTVTQSLAFVPRALKVGTLIKLLGDERMSRVIVFTKTKHGADKVAKKLIHAGVESEAIHGNRNQNQRQRALNAFKSGRARVLVATDVAARGLDVDDITHVINLDLPMEPEAYVHRIGRTGRAGASGVAISFCDESERPLLRDIERMLGKKIPLAHLGLTEAEAKDARQLEKHFAHDLDNLIDIKPGWNQAPFDAPPPRGQQSHHPRSEESAQHPQRTQHDHPGRPQHRFGPRHGAKDQSGPQSRQQTSQHNPQYKAQQNDQSGEPRAPQQERRNNQDGLIRRGSSPDGMNSGTPQSHLQSGHAPSKFKPKFRQNINQNANQSSHKKGAGKPSKPGHAAHSGKPSGKSGGTSKGRFGPPSSR